MAMRKQRAAGRGFVGAFGVADFRQAHQCEQHRKRQQRGGQREVWPLDRGRFLGMVGEHLGRRHRGQLGRGQDSR